MLKHGKPKYISYSRVSRLSKVSSAEKVPYHVTNPEIVKKISNCNKKIENENKSE